MLVAGKAKMADTNINEVLATKVMEYELVNPDLSSSDCRNSYNKPMYFKDGKPLIGCVSWNPLENIDQAMMVADKFDDFTVQRILGLWNVMIERDLNVGTEECRTLLELPKAICLATMKAIGEDDG